MLIFEFHGSTGFTDIYRVVKETGDRKITLGVLRWDKDRYRYFQYVPEPLDFDTMFEMCMFIDKLRMEHENVIRKKA